MLNTGSVGGEGGTATNVKKQIYLSCWIYIIRSDGTIHDQIEVSYPSIKKAYWTAKKKKVVE